MSTRRRFLGTIVKALGAGGLLLPGTGKDAFALPADLGEAARLPVTATPLSFSDEALALRKLRRALNALPPNRGEPDGGAWRRMMVGEYSPLKTALVERPVRSWADCVGAG